jgi:hypothetical protein
VLQNVSSSAIELTPNSKTDGITISRGSTVVWHSTRTVPSDATHTVQPGQALTVTASWNGRPNERGVKRLTAGVYTVAFAEGGYTASATIQIVR